MTSSVFVVTEDDGDYYPDIRVKAIFSSRELAEKFVAAIPARYSKTVEIENFPLDIHVPPPGMTKYLVVFRKNGKSVAHPADPCDMIDSDIQPYGDNKRMCSLCWARDKNHAIEIVNRRRIELIEKGGWITSQLKWKKRLAETPK